MGFGTPNYMKDPRDLIWVTQQSPSPEVAKMKIVLSSKNICGFGDLGPRHLWEETQLTHRPL